MSDTMPPPPTVTPGPPAPSSGAADRSARRLGWIGLVAAVVVLSMLVGAVGAVGVARLVGFGAPPDRYVVTVFMKVDSTGEQKEAVRSALSARYPGDEVRLESRERTWERFRELYRDDLELTDESAEALAESYRVVLDDTAIDCPALAPVRSMPGVGMVTVVQPPTEGQPNALALDCP